jgi:hypothetical protein
MNSILILLALSLLAGVVAARSYFSWPALIVASLVIAPTAAVVLQQESFAALSGILVIIACLMAGQVAYGMAMRLSNNAGAVSDDAQQFQGSTVSEAAE